MKFRIIPILLAVLLLTGCSAIQKLDAAEDRFDAAEDRFEQQIFSPSPDQLTEEEAIDIALQHADLTADEAEYLHSVYELDDGIAHYDISFLYKGMEYEYEISADTGKILSFDVGN